MGPLSQKNKFRLLLAACIVVMALIVGAMVAFFMGEAAWGVAKSVLVWVLLIAVMAVLLALAAVRSSKPKE